MRTNLENIELIEKYLNGELTIEEKSIVEEKLQSDAAFKNQLTTQKNLRDVINRVALRKEINTIVKSSGGSSGLGKWIIGGLIILTAGISLFYFSNIKEKDNTSESVTRQLNSNDKPEIKNNYFDFNGLHTWVMPKVQTYDVKADKGALIQAESGTLITIPKNAFVDNQGKLVAGTVQLKIVEAINLEDIVLYNLGTTADGKPLQTGGMIDFEYESNGEKVNVNPERPLYVQIPTTKVKDNMQVFEGEIENGKLNWKNPQPLKKYLINMDFNLLDFLPQGFSDSVATFIPYKKHLLNNKELTDSLYYSLLFGKYNENFDELVGNVSSIVIPDSSKTNPKALTAYGWSTQNKNKNQPLSVCGIDPLSIKTIKTKAFEKTFLATKEFEERVRELHGIENGDKLLKIYVDNLGKNLSFSDSLVAIQLKGKDKTNFKTFAAQRLTNIKDAAIYQEALSNYFNNKQIEFLREQQRLATTLRTINKAQLNKLLEDYNKAITQNGNVFSISFRNSVQQNALSASASNNPYYSFTWAKDGWVNIDAYLHILSKGSQKVKMNVAGNTGQTEVYQYLNEVGNLTPLDLKDSVAFALVPIAGSEYAANMQNTYCMAISKDGDTYKWFDRKYNPYQDAEININLENTDINSIRQKLRAYGVTKDLIVRLDEVKRQEEKNAELAAEMTKKLEGFKIKQAAMLKDAEMIKTLRKVAFKCEEENHFASEAKK